MDERERPVEVERETTVINAGGDRGGGGGTVAAVVVLLLIAVLAFLFFGGYFESAADEVGVNVNVEAPDVKMPDINIDTGKSESTPSNTSGE
jgi:hypothetical protein